MAAMKGAGAAAIKSMLPDHTKMVDSVFSQMNEQMRSMVMTRTTA